jgi:hypothetical protein
MGELMEWARILAYISVWWLRFFEQNLGAPSDPEQLFQLIPSSRTD